MEIEHRDPRDLKPHPRNVRTHTRDQITALGRAFAEFGMHQPVVVDEGDTILIGHARTQAAIATDLAAIPTIRKRGLTDEQKRSLILADNRLGEVGSGWDEDKLQEELRHLLGADFDLTLTGFDLGEYGRERPEPEPKEPRVQPGDMWQVGRCTLTCAEPGPWMGDLGAKLLLARYPEEGNPSIAWSGLTTAYILASPAHDLRGLRALQAAGFEVRSQIVADIPDATGRPGYGIAHRILWYGVRKGAKADWRGGRKQSTLWQPRDDVPRGDLPADLWARAITNHTAPQDMVAIAWCGSGAALVAAASTGRSAVAVEPDPAACDRALARWEGLTGVEAIRKRTE